MHISDFLNESVNINEDKVATIAFKKIKKYANKETMDMSSKGFGGFKKDGRIMFAEFYREVVFGVLEDINFPEVKKLNDHLGRKHIGKLDDKKRRYMDNVLLSDERMIPFINKISEICKWDVTTFSMSINMFFDDQGFRDMIVSDGMEEIGESFIITNTITPDENQEQDIYNFILKSYKKKYKSEYWHFSFNGTNLNLKSRNFRAVYEIHGDDGSFYATVDLDSDIKPIKNTLKIETKI